MQPRSVLPPLSILLLAGWLRFRNMMNFDTFGDEYLHVYRAQRIAMGDTFNGLEQNKWFYTLTLALFNPRGQESIFLGSVLSILASLITVAAVIVLGRVLINRSVGWLSGLLYAVLPLAVLHERIALVDSFLAMFCTLSVLLIVRIAKQPRPAYIILVALTLTAGYLTKVPGIAYFAVPFIAAAVYGLNWQR